MRTKIILIAQLSLVVLIAAACGQTSTETQRTPPSRSEPSQPATTTQSQARVPAYYPNAGSIGALRPTLSPERFIGPAQDAYRVAQLIPETIAQLPCYCHCDMSMGHKSLHSCFEDMHASQCAVCVSEALEAYNLQKSGMTPAQIRQRIIVQYSQQQ